jgi:hypothetical protein
MEASRQHQLCIQCSYSDQLEKQATPSTARPESHLICVPVVLHADTKLCAERCTSSAARPLLIPSSNIAGELEQHQRGSCYYSMTSPHVYLIHIETMPTQK